MSAKVDLLIAIVNRFLASTYCLATFSDIPLEAFDVGLPSLRFDSRNLTGDLTEAFDHGCSHFVICLKNPIAFLESYERATRESNQRRGNRKLIFLPLEDDLANRKMLINITQSKVVVPFVPNILLVLPSDCRSKKNCTQYELATHKYVGKTGHHDLVILDTWMPSNSSFAKGSNLFPDKLLNLESKIIRLATFYYKPYSIFKTDDNGTILDFDGSDTRVIFEFCKKINCTYEVVIDDRGWGEVFENRSGYGISGNVYSEKADIGFAGASMWIGDNMLMDHAIPAVRSGVPCVTPSPLPVPRWLLPIIPFNTVLWTSVILSLIIGAAGVHMAAKGTKRTISGSESILISFGILLLQDPQLKPINHFRYLQHVINYLLFLSLFLTTIYCSKLSSAITVPKYYDPIDNIQQLADSGLEWGAPTDGWTQAIAHSNEAKYRKLVTTFRVYPPEVLKKKTRTRDYAFVVERLESGHMAVGDYITEEDVPYLQLMEEDLYFEYLAFMLRKNSPFTEKLNKLFGQLHQAGLIHAWETQIVSIHSKLIIQMGIKSSAGKHGSESGIRPLGTSFLQGPFYMLLIGLGISTAAFALEVSKAKKRRKLLVQKYLNLFRPVAPR